MTIKTAILKILFYVVIAIYVFMVMYPIFLMTITALKPTAEIFQNPHGLPEGFYMGNFSELFERANYGIYIRNSVLVVLVSLIFIVLFAAPAAFVFAKFPSRINAFLFAYFLAGLVIPIRLGTISLLKMSVATGLHDNIVALMIINVAIGIPLGIFILTNYIKMIPSELFDAARIDGCNEPNVFLRIVLPLSLPPIAILAIVMFIPIWNDFWFPLILIQSDSMKTIPLATALLFGQFRTDFGLVFASLTMASIPTIFFYLVFSRFFVKGLFSGAVKG